MSQLTDRDRSQLLPPFWPLDAPHGVGSPIPLETEPPSNPAAVTPLLLRLAAQSEALRNLQAANGSFVSPRGAAALKEEIADGLFELAELVDDESAAVIRQRAEVLAGRADQRETVLQIAKDNTRPPLQIVCGPLCTWRPKTREALHSFIAAARDERLQEVLDNLDASLDEALEELHRDLDAPGLKSDFSLPMNATSLIASAGEAAGHPKHFAYFLPEDEGIDDLPLEEQRTLYLSNVHSARYSLITIPLAEALLDGPMHAADAPIDATLMPWIRGHDLGHNLIVPETDYDRWKETLGIEPFMMLQEAVADVYGFLLAISEPWRRIAGIDRLDMCATHIAELLHYMRRGPQYDGDPGAAYLELSFLAENEFVEIDAEGRIHWTEEGLCSGLTALAKALTQSTVAAENERSSRELIDRYGWPAETPAKRTWEALSGELSNVPTSIAFYNTSDVATSESVPVAV